MNKAPNETVVAIVGASNDRSKFGNKALRAYLKRGFAVYPVSNREKTVEGLEAYPSVADIPGDIDRVSVYLRPKDTLEVLDDIAKKGTGELFLNPGSEDAAVVEKAKSLGLEPILACSIIDVGESPASY